jgi:hypothetical protein
VRRTIHRRDRDHDALTAALRRLGIPHIDTHNYGGGMGDVLARHVYTQEAVFIELKSSPKDKLTPAEVKFSEMFPSNWVRANSVEEALSCLGITARAYDRE